MSVEQLKDRIGNALSRLRGRPTVSFEFFPPKDEQMEQTLWQSVERLTPLQPRFVSVTYGADGSTRTRTHNIVTQHPADDAADRRAASHVRRRAARRNPRYRAQLLGARHSPHRRAARRSAAGRAASTCRIRAASPTRSIWCKGLKSVGDFEISVATYPEPHPEAPNAAFELDNLKAKLDAGADRAITQFFFDADAFLRFRDQCAAAGIRRSIVPGILPITRFPQMLRMAQRCGASVPDWLVHRFDGLDDDPDTRRLIAAAVAIEQVQAAASATASRSSTSTRSIAPS